MLNIEVFSLVKIVNKHYVTYTYIKIFLRFFLLACYILLYNKYIVQGLQNIMTKRSQAIDDGIIDQVKKVVLYI